ncbi:MAG: baseplate J/gp47 family protein [Faecalibacterium sp.]
MSQIEEFANLPRVSITGAETLEQTIAKCRELYAKFDKELNGNNSEYTLARCNVANLVLLTMAYRFHHQMEYTDAWGRAELLPTSTGAALDNLAPLVGIGRMPAGRATVALRFTLSAVRPGAITIPEGTRVRTGDGIYFRTSKLAEIMPGEMTVDVMAQAEEAGAKSDGLPPGEINILVDPIPYMKEVTNISESTGGTDVEGDDSLTRRIYLAPSAFSVAGPQDAYEYYASSWRADLTDKKIVCEKGYTVHIFFLMEDERRLPTKEECAALEQYFEGVRKPMGDLVKAHAPEEVEYSIALSYYIASSDARSATTIQENVNRAVRDYILWQRKIGRDIDNSELIKRVRQAGAKRPTLTAPVNTKVSRIQVAKLTSCSVTYGGVEDD